MSRHLQNAAMLLAAVAVVATSANFAQAGCRRHRVIHHYPVHRHVHRVHRVIHKPVIVHPPVAIAPVKPVAHLPSVPAGSTLTLPGNFLGPNPGHVFLVLNKVKLPVRIDNWTPTGVTMTLPPMAVKQPTPARIDVVLEHGQLANKLKILLTPPAALVLHPSAPASPLPTAQPAVAQLAAPPLTPTGQPGIPQIGAPIIQGTTQQ